MERLTCKYSGLYALRELCTFDRLSDKEPDDCASCGECCEEYLQHDCFNCPIQNAFDKLAEYEEAEESGLLLRLPCPIGTKIYGYEIQFWIDRKGCKDCVYYCDCGADSFCDYMEACPACTKIIETTFELKLLDKIGESLFLTKEEAEAALKELKMMQENEA